VNFIRNLPACTDASGNAEPLPGVEAATGADARRREQAVALAEFRRIEELVRVQREEQRCRILARALAHLPSKIPHGVATPGDEILPERGFSALRYAERIKALLQRS
jgi:hypothetical protein